MGTVASAVSATIVATGVMVKRQMMTVAVAMVEMAVETE